RLEGRDVERVQRLARLLGQRDQAGQESRQRLAAAGRRDQQRRATGACRGEHGELVGVRLPAAPREPVREARRQRGRQGRAVHAGRLARLKRKGESRARLSPSVAQVRRITWWTWTAGSACCSWPRSRCPSPGLPCWD